jgi:hypothetical protein
MNHSRHRSEEFQIPNKCIHSKQGTLSHNALASYPERLRKISAPNSVEKVLSWQKVFIKKKL